ncbi:MAG: hypothetical protein Q9M76_00175 [Candidatus Dojkabacteria bacterium]|nr:hypothetical protein [Candidatus Dojkabacteria bacterium]
MNKSLIKVLGHTIVPAFVLVVSKLIGVIFSAEVLSSNIKFKDISDSILKSGTFVNGSDLLEINSYSDLIMYVAIASYFSLILIRSVYLHNTHVNPIHVRRLHKLNLTALIKDTYDIYHEATVGMFFLWITNTIILINTFLERTYLWVSILTLLSSLLLSIILIHDVNREIKEFNTKRVI